MQHIVHFGVMFDLLLHTFVFMKSTDYKIKSINSYLNKLD